MPINYWENKFCSNVSIKRAEKDSPEVSMSPEAQGQNFSSLMINIVLTECTCLFTQKHSCRWHVRKYEPEIIAIQLRF